MVDPMLFPPSYSQDPPDPPENYDPDDDRRYWMVVENEGDEGERALVYDLLEPDEPCVFVGSVDEADRWVEDHNDAHNVCERFRNELAGDPFEGLVERAFDLAFPQGVFNSGRPEGRTKR